MNEPNALLKKLVEQGKTPSVQYIFFDEEKIIHRFYDGLSDVKNNKEIDRNTTYNVFSVTKTFTALAVLQLQQQDLLDIDDPVVKYLPDFRFNKEITIRQLLTHSAGIPSPIPLRWIHLVEEKDRFDRDSFFEQIFQNNKKEKFLPNKKFSYSNLGYVLLGQLIEKMSGTSYENYVNKYILEPLGLSQDKIGFTIRPEIHAKGYHNRMSISFALLGFLIDKRKFMGEKEGKWKPFKFNYVNGASYGGLIATPDALVSYLQQLLKCNGKLLASGLQKLLFTENRTTDNKRTGMCLSWFKGSLKGIEYFTHAGGGGGYYVEIRVYPEKRRGSVVVFNRSGMADERFLDKVDKFFLTE